VVAAARVVVGVVTAAHRKRGVTHLNAQNRQAADQSLRHALELCQKAHAKD